MIVNWFPQAFIQIPVGCFHAQVDRMEKLPADTLIQHCEFSWPEKPELYWQQLAPCIYILLQYIPCAISWNRNNISCLLSSVTAINNWKKKPQNQKTKLVLHSQTYVKATTCKQERCKRTEQSKTKWMKPNSPSKRRKHESIQTLYINLTNTLHHIQKIPCTKHTSKPTELIKIAKE